MKKSAGDEEKERRKREKKLEHTIFIKFYLFFLCDVALLHFHGFYLTYVQFQHFQLFFFSNFFVQLRAWQFISRPTFGREKSKFGQIVYSEYLWRNLHTLSLNTNI